MTLKALLIIYSQQEYSLIRKGVYRLGDNLHNIITRLQLLKPTPGKRKTCVKFKENENTPLALVVVVATTTAPHCSCT